MHIILKQLMMIQCNTRNDMLNIQTLNVIIAKCSLQSYRAYLFASLLLIFLLVFEKHMFQLSLICNFSANKFLKPFYFDIN